MTQKIKTVLIPEGGIDLQPEGVMESVIETDFIRALTHLIAQGPSGSRALICTSDGRLQVVSTGTFLEVYAVENGDAPDAYNAGSTFEFVVAQHVTDILIEANDATISFRNAGGIWGGDKAITIGAASIDLIHYGIRIQNRVGLAVAEYEITTYY